MTLLVKPVQSYTFLTLLLFSLSLQALWSFARFANNLCAENDLPAQPRCLQTTPPDTQPVLELPL